jgi:hypothetical protein
MSLSVRKSWREALPQANRLGLVLAHQGSRRPVLSGAESEPMRNRQYLALVSGREPKRSSKGSTPSSPALGSSQSEPSRPESLLDLFDLILLQMEESDRRLLRLIDGLKDG